MKWIFRIFLVCVFMPGIHLQAQVPGPDVVLKAAAGQIGHFTKDVPEGLLPDYGFSGRDELKRITFGAPVAVYTLKDSAVVFTDTWRVPVMIGQEYRSLLTVVLEKGALKAVDFGAVELAQAIRKNRTAKTTGMLRVYEIRKDFLMEGPAQANPPLIPIEYTR
jgi:hypothetical protein